MSARYQVVGAIDRSAAEQIEGADGDRSVATDGGERR
jgi:hypothetical protein